MKKYPIIYSLILLLSMNSCGSEFDYSLEDVGLLEVSSRMVTFSAGESSGKVEVSSDVEWTVSADDASWLIIEQQEDGIALGVTSNSDIPAREAVLTVQAGDRKMEIKVRQEGAQPYFTSSKELIEFVYGGGNESVEITANVDWEAKTYGDWITLTKTDSGLAISTSENKASRVRTASVDFYNSGYRFASILVSQASSVPQPADYYSIDMSAVEWGVSYIHYVKDSKGGLIGILTQEYEGGKVGTFMYPSSAGEEDFSTKDPVSATQMMYIRADSGQMYDYDPHVGFETVEAATLAPLAVTTDVKTHGAVKIGDQIWLAEDYKTTKYVDGTAISSYRNGDSFWTSGDAVVAIHDGHYNYTGYTIGWDGSKCDDKNFAPEGWAVPTKDQYLALVGTTGKNYVDMMDKYLFKATGNYKFTKDKNGNVQVSALNYTNTWTCTESSGKLLMLGLKPDNNSVNSAQAVTGCFAVRLIKK